MTEMKNNEIKNNTKKKYDKELGFFYTTTKKNGKTIPCIRTYCKNCGKLFYIDKRTLTIAKIKGKAIQCDTPYCDNRLFTYKQVSAGWNFLNRVEKGKAIDLYVNSHQR